MESCGRRRSVGFEFQGRPGSGDGQFSSGETEDRGGVGGNAQIRLPLRFMSVGQSSVDAREADRGTTDVELDDGARLDPTGAECVQRQDEPLRPELVVSRSRDHPPPAPADERMYSLPQFAPRLGELVHGACRRRGQVATGDQTVVSKLPEAVSQQVVGDARETFTQVGEALVPSTPTTADPIMNRAVRRRLTRS